VAADKRPLYRATIPRPTTILDVGKPCPDHLPAHAHADLLSYELMVAGCRIVVDSGVYEYTAGPWRDYFRSTRAHNTVEVGGTDQSEGGTASRRGERAQMRFIGRDRFIGVARSSHDGPAGCDLGLCTALVMWLSILLILDEPKRARLSQPRPLSSQSLPR
jgi:hypothetical protein